MHYLFTSLKLCSVLTFHWECLLYQICTDLQSIFLLWFLEQWVACCCCCCCTLIHCSCSDHHHRHHRHQHQRHQQTRAHTHRPAATFHCSATRHTSLEYLCNLSAHLKLASNNNSYNNSYNSNNSNNNLLLALFLPSELLTTSATGATRSRVICFVNEQKCKTKTKNKNKNQQQKIEKN